MIFLVDREGGNFLEGAFEQGYTVSSKSIQRHNPTPLLLHSGGGKIYKKIFYYIYHRNRKKCLQLGGREKLVCHGILKPQQFWVGHMVRSIYNIKYII